MQHTGLNTNVTLYHSKRDNYAVSTEWNSSYIYPLQCCFNEDGKFVAQGLEMDVNGALTNNWQINENLIVTKMHWQKV